MPIYAPAKRINPTLRRRTAIGRKEVFAGLFLTSMVDMFAILVIFLLQSFSSEGELIVLPSGLELPKAANVGSLEKAPSLTIARDQIMFEGKFVANTSEIDSTEEWHLPALQKVLKEYMAKVKAEQVAQNKTEDEIKKETQKINISADRRLQFGTVRKVIYNAGFAGFPDFRFAVFPGSTSSTSATQN